MNLIQKLMMRFQQDEWQMHGFSWTKHLDTFLFVSLKDHLRMIYLENTGVFTS